MGVQEAMRMSKAKADSLVEELMAKEYEWQ